MSTNATEPTGRYSVKSEGLSLLESGTFVGVTGLLTMYPFQAWSLQDAPADIATPGKQCYILSNENTGLYLTTGGVSNIPLPPTSEPSVAVATKDQLDFVLVPLDATTTADPSAAWVFVLDGAGSGTGTFEGKIASPDGKYKLGWYRTEPAESPVAATVCMSPEPFEGVHGMTQWTLQLSLLDETK